MLIFFISFFFSAPPGCAVPFGLMLKAGKNSWSQYKAAADEFDAKATKGETAEVLAADMRALIEREWKVHACCVC